LRGSLVFVDEGPGVTARSIRAAAQATDADSFFKELGKHLSKRTLVMIKSTLRRSIRRARVYNLIGRNVVELIDLPSGKPGRPSRAMTQAQAAQAITQPLPLDPARR
jgi:hypothetical protein